MMCQGAIKGLEGGAATSRKYSLPVQLESNVAEMAEQKRSPNLLFKAPCDQDEDNPASDQLGSLVASTSTTSEGAAAESQRRSSHTIARQSSFWLEDGGETSKRSELSGRLTDGRGEICDANNQAASADKSALAERPVSSASSSSSAVSPPPEAAPTKKPNRRHPSNSSSSSPSPTADFFGLKQKSARPLGLSSSAASISKRRALERLRSRRANRRLSSSTRSKRLHSEHEGGDGGKGQSPDAISSHEDLSRNSKELEASAGLLQQGDSTERDDSLALSLDRDFLITPQQPPGSGRALGDANSASLERQCRDLWKLRSTLHNDVASVGDNWSNYHQRLNRRYDSGYKSIENPFNSSLEGNRPPSVESGTRGSLGAATGEAAEQTKLESAAPGELSGSERFRRFEASRTSPLARPRSGCSNLIRQPSPLPGRRSTTPLSEDEEALALLADCDDLQDDAS